MKRAKWSVSLGLILAAVCLIVAVSMIFRPSAPTVIWGGSELTVSERDYFLNRMAVLLQTWRPRNPEASFRETATQDDPLLMIDLEHRMLWTASPETSEALDWIELPAALDWTLYFPEGNKVKTLPPFVGLRSLFPSTGSITLVGQDQGQYITLDFFHRPTSEIVWGNGQFDPNRLPRILWSHQRLATLTIANEERLHQLAQHRPPPQQLDKVGTSNGDDLAPDTVNRTAWQKLQKSLYQTLEQEAINAGYEVERITAHPGPDYSAGLAGLSLTELPPTIIMQKLLRLIHKPWRPNQQRQFLTINALADGRWHCQSTATHTGPRRWRGQSNPSFNFYVDPPAPSLIEVSDRREPHLGVPTWSLTLSNGTTVDIVGLCTNQGNQWWAPDGTPLAFWPGFLPRIDGFSLINRDLAHLLQSSRRPPFMRISRPLLEFDIEKEDAWPTLLLRVPSSRGFNNRSGSSGRNHAQLHYGDSPLVDHFGQPIFPGQYITIKFDAQTQDVTTYCLGIHVLQNPKVRPEIITPLYKAADYVSITTGNAATPPTHILTDSELNTLSTDWITLDNMSLQPGNITDFQMSLTDDPCDTADAIQFAVQP